jgi:hypothetical protein
VIARLEALPANHDVAAGNGRCRGDALDDYLSPHDLGLVRPAGSGSQSELPPDPKDQKAQPSRQQIVRYHAPTAAEPLHSADGKWLYHVEDTEEYKRRTNIFPPGDQKSKRRLTHEWQAKQSYLLAGNFVKNRFARIAPAKMLFAL